MSPPPPYTILPATPSDIDALIAISEAAFAGDALIRQYFHPGVDLEATLRVFRRKRTTLDLTYPAPHVHTLKAVDSTSGEVLGLARWVRPSSTSPIPGNGDVDGEDQAAGVRNVEMDEIDHAFRAKVTGMLEEKKKELMGEGRDFWHLVSLAVAPSAKGKGVGTALVEWGTKQADEQGKQCYVEGTEAAEGLYTRCGFVGKEWLDFGGGARRLCMIREAR